MRIFRWFSINTLILIFACSTLLLSVRQAFEIFEGFDTLVAHRGIVHSKFLPYKYFTSKYSPKDSVNLFQFKIVGDSTLYTASRYPKALDNLIRIGDSVTFYTKPVKSSFGNTVLSGNRRLWKTRSPNEVYHVVTPEYNAPIIDYNDHIQSLKESMWILPLFSVLLFGLFFYRRSGVSPLVIEIKML